MQATIDHLEHIIRSYTPKLEGLREETYTYKPRPEKWSKQEILGHLVDSAQNNIRRFVAGQYEENPRILYDQDRWVNIAAYNQYPLRDLIRLWALLNNHICRILGNTSLEVAQRKCDMGSSGLKTIEWLAADYCNHLLHHLHQILDLEPIAYP